MNKQIVLFAIGPDRPGLVMEITSAIHSAGANLEDSRMASLAGDFALIVLFSGTDEVIETARKNCLALEARLQVTMHFKAASARSTAGKTSLYQFEATGSDQPGIVRRISAVFAEVGANVESLETSLVNAAFHGTPLFRVRGQVAVPESVSVPALRLTLEDTCAEMNLSLDFAAVN